jgi:16S rRNA (cytidine1402-2'-O)-methyltransferase
VGTLYVVATPIGNLEDITLRALRVLREASYVVAEDTRVTAKLLARHKIETPTLSLHARSSRRRLLEVLARLDERDLALVSDAGTPGISDPGAELVSAARSAGHHVVPVPGASALTALLSVAGMPADQFTLLGFLPRRPRDRAQVLAQVSTHVWPLVVFEAPHRLLNTLEALVAELGDRQVAIGRELTKLHEELWLGSLSDAHSEWSGRAPRGEFVLAVAGHEADEVEPWPDSAVLTEMDRLVRDGSSARDASRQVAGVAGRTAREIYSLWHRESP